MKAEPALLLVPLVMHTVLLNALYIPPTDTSSLKAKSISNQQLGRDSLPSDKETEQRNNEAGHKRERGASNNEASPVINTPPTLTTEITLPQISNIPAKSASPISGKVKEYRMNEEAIKKLEKLATSLIDCIVPVIILITSSGAIWYLHRQNDDSGLVTGAAASAGVLMLIQADATASQPLIIAAAAVYLGFHIAYCKAVTKSLSHADGFVAVTIIAATAMLAIFAHLPSITNLWKESSGVPMLWDIFPLHLVSVFFCSLAVRVTRRYLE